MALRNTDSWYGGGSRVLHWLVAILVIGLFVLGYWMRGLNYYDPMYQVAPNIHKSFGMIFVLLVILRLFWRLGNVKPRELAGSALEHLAARVAHLFLYVLMIGMAVTGYIYATGDGKPIEVFSSLTLSSYIKNKPLADLAGEAHEIMAYAIILVALVHAAGAFKHHFIDRDDTLRRMIKRDPQQ